MLSPWKRHSIGKEGGAVSTRLLRHLRETRVQVVGRVHVIAPLVVQAQHSARGIVASVIRHRNTDQERA
jgi:hypothetical protein